MKKPITLVLLFYIATVVSEEVGEKTNKLIIPIAQQGDAATLRPARGTLMGDVEKNYGRPNEIVGPIGQPPITRWVYDNYTVIFEHQHVVHTVLKMKSPTAPETVGEKSETTPVPADNSITTPEP